MPFAPGSCRHDRRRGLRCLTGRRTGQRDRQRPRPIRPACSPLRVTFGPKPPIRTARCFKPSCGRGSCGCIASQALRLHHSLWHSESGQRRPAMVARIDHPARGFCAVHCTYLAIDGSQKASLDPVGKTIGTFRRCGALWPPGSSPLARHRRGDRDGVERCPGAALPELGRPQHRRAHRSTTAARGQARADRR
jgi:hypothetical protein